MRNKYIYQLLKAPIYVKFSKNYYKKTNILIGINASIYILPHLPHGFANAKTLARSDCASMIKNYAYRALSQLRSLKATEHIFNLFEIVNNTRREAI